MGSSVDHHIERTGDVNAILAHVEELQRAKDEKTVQLQRIQRQQTAIVTLARHDAMAAGDFDRACRVITKNASDAMDVERVGIWTLSPDRRQLYCRDLYERTPAAHSRGMTLDAAQCPRYFAALEMGRAIDAEDARADPRTSEFLADYLKPQNIASMLDATIRVSGRVIGVVCHEHIGAVRSWRPDEIAFAGTVADQAAQAYAAGELMQKEAMLQTIFRAAPIGIGLVTDRVLGWTNDQVRRMTGYAAEELAGRSARMLYESDEEFERVGRLKHADIRENNLGVIETRWRRKDGAVIDVLLSSAAVVPGDLSAGLVFTATDVTAKKRGEEERRALEARIQHTQKLESLGLLAGGIAHDFNNILVGILGNARLALAEVPQKSPARDVLMRLDLAARRAADLTAQLLAYSGRGKFVVQPVHVSRLVEEMAHLLETSISKKADLACECDEDLPLVEADATQLRQIIMNLITNASDAIGGAAGEIRIRTGSEIAGRKVLAAYQLGEDLPEGRYVWLEVSDTGRGMTPEAQARMFEPFFTTKFTGRGLGLAAVLGIVRSHRAAIRVESAPGRGTRVRILFPASDKPAAPEADQPRAAPAAKAPATLSAPADKVLATLSAPADKVAGTVLVADDEEMVRSVARMSLERAGFTVLTAADGREAIEVFKQHQDAIGAVVLDMTMPFLSGEEVFFELRRARAEVPVLLSSGYSEQEATGHFSGSGLAGFIQKPYMPHELVAKVAAVIKI